MADRYWVGGTGNWSDGTNHWSTSSGGSPGAAAPTSSDNVYVNASSGSGTITFDATAACATLDASASSITEFTGSESLSVYGNFSLKSGLTWSHDGDLIFCGTGSYTITTNSVDVGGYIIFSNVSGSWTLQDNLTTSTTYAVLEAGLIDFNDHDFTSQGIYANYSAANSSIDLGNGIITFFADWYDADLGGVTISNAGSSTIVISGDNMTVTLPATANGAINNLSITGTNCLIKGSATMNVLSIDASPVTVKFFQGTTNVVSDFQATGSSGNVITINSYNGSDQFTLSKSSGIVGCDYLNLNNSNVTGGADWYAGANSADTSNNDGWIFANAPVTFGDTVNRLLTQSTTETISGKALFQDTIDHLVINSYTNFSVSGGANFLETVDRLWIQPTTESLVFEANVSDSISRLKFNRSTEIITAEQAWGSQTPIETGWQSSSSSSTTWADGASIETGWSDV